MSCRVSVVEYPYRVGILHARWIAYPASLVLSSAQRMGYAKENGQGTKRGRNIDHQLLYLAFDMTKLDLVYTNARSKAPPSV